MHSFGSAHQQTIYPVREIKFVSLRKKNNKNENKFVIITVYRIPTLTNFCNETNLSWW